MALHRIRALINNAQFPFLYEHAGRSVVESQDLAPRMPGTFYGSPANQEVGVPAVIFAENVVPLARGFLSVGFTQQNAGPTPAQTEMDQGIPLRDPDENQALFVPARGANWVFDPSTLTWAQKSPFTLGSGLALVTRAYVNGRTFVFYEKTKLLEYNYGAGTLDTLVLTLPAGYAITDIRGIGSAGPYLLLFTDVEILWSSPLNVLDFADLDAGAGAQVPADLKGQITSILATSKGAIAYTTRNAVAMRVTNNSVAPFVFTAIDGAGGCSNWERVAADSVEDAQYAWTTAGLQRISMQSAETIDPEVTDFLVGGKLEQWNPVTKRVDSISASGPFSVKLSLLAQRYLVISYGTQTKEYTHALMYDISLRRWGKVRFTHSDVFMYTYPSLSGDYDYDELPGDYADLLDLEYDDLSIVQALALPAKRGICFMPRDGSLNIMLTDFAQVNDGGVLLFGHLQFMRNNETTVQRIEIEGVKNDPLPEVTIISSDNGFNRNFITTPALKDSTDNYSNYDSRVTAKNHDIALEGCFMLTGLLVEVTKHGHR